MLRMTIAAFLAVFCTVASAQNWTDTEFDGRSVQPNNNLDAFDFFTGTSSVIQNDYSIKIGSTSSFPLTRTMQINHGNSGFYFNRSMVLAYGLGQINQKILSSFCGLNDDFTPKEKISKSFSMRAHTGSAITFDDSRISKSKWKAECSIDDNSDLFHVMSPDGWTYKYKIPSSNLREEWAYAGFPYRIEDNAGNYVDIEVGSGSDLELTLTTRFNTLVLNKNKLTIDTHSEPVLEFNYDSLGSFLTVTYAGSGTWRFTRLSNSKKQVCNPLKACVTVTYEDSPFKNISEPYGHRIVSREFQIPHQGDFTYTYTYERPEPTANSMVVVENRGDYQVKKYFKKFYVSIFDDEAWDDYKENPPWDEGNLEQSEIVLDGHIIQQSKNTFAKSDSVVLTQVAMNLRDSGPFIGAVKSLLSKNKPAILTRSVEKKWAINSGETEPVWIGTVVTDYSEFDEHLRANKTTYSYPAYVEANDGTGSNLFDSRSYVTQYEALPELYHLGLVKLSKLEGSQYESSYVYFDNGLLKSKTKNGIESQYTYGNYDELATFTDPNGVIIQYSDYEHGIAKTIIGAEGYTKTRTVSKGFVETETEWGDRVTTYSYDVFGDLESLSSPELRVVNHDYTYPPSGGTEHKVSTSEGSVTKLYSGLGKLIKTTQEALPVGTGSAVYSKSEIGYDNHGRLLFTTVNHDGLVNDLTGLKNTFSSLPNGLPLENKTVQGAVTNYYYLGPFNYEVVDFRGNKQVIKSQPLRGFGSEQPTEVLYTGPEATPATEILVNKNYYPEGRLESVATGNEVFNYIYDHHGRIKSFESKAEGKIQYDHDLNGNLTFLQKANGKPVTIQYDDLNRETHKLYDDAAANVITYYYESQQKTVVSKGGLRWDYWYDKDRLITLARLHYNLNNPKSDVIHKYPDYRNVSGLSSTSNSFSVGRVLYPSQSYWDFEYDYSESGNLAAITYPDGERIPFMPNAFGQATQADNYVSHAQYWPDGSLKAVTYRNGIKSEYRQDSSHKLSEIQHGNHWHQSLDIEGGRIVTGIYDHITPSKSLGMSYDHIYQLSTVHDYADPSIVFENFSYDNQGNMTSRSGIYGSYVYNISPENNRLIDVEINGSETKVIGYDDEYKVSVYGSKYFAYSNDGHLVYHDDSDQVEWTYQYDGNGRKTFTYKNGTLHQVTVYDHRDQLIYEEIVGKDGRTSNLIYLNDALVARRDGEFYVTTVQCKEDVNHRDFKTYLYERNVYLYKNSQNESYLAGNTNVADVAFMGECKDDTPARTFQHYADKKWTGWSSGASEFHRKHYFRKMQYERVRSGNSYKYYYRGGFYGYYDQMDRMFDKIWTAGSAGYSSKYRKSTWWHYRDCYREWKIVYRDYPNGHGSGLSPTGNKTWKTYKYKYKSYKWHKFSGNKNKHKCSTSWTSANNYYVLDRYGKFPSVNSLPRPTYYKSYNFENM